MCPEMKANQGVVKYSGTPLEAPVEIKQR